MQHRFAMLLCACALAVVEAQLIGDNSHGNDYPLLWSQALKRTTIRDFRGSTEVSQECRLSGNFQSLTLTIPETCCYDSSNCQRLGFTTPTQDADCWEHGERGIKIEFPFPNQCPGGSYNGTGALATCRREWEMVSYAWKPRFYIPGSYMAPKNSAQTTVQYYLAVHREGSRAGGTLLQSKSFATVAPIGLYDISRWIQDSQSPEPLDGFFVGDLTLAQVSWGKGSSYPTASLTTTKVRWNLTTVDALMRGVVPRFLSTTYGPQLLIESLVGRATIGDGPISFWVDILLAGKFPTLNVYPTEMTSCSVATDFDLNAGAPPIPRDAGYGVTAWYCMPSETAASGPQPRVLQTGLLDWDEVQGEGEFPYPLRFPGTPVSGQTYGSMAYNTFPMSAAFFRAIAFVTPPKMLMMDKNQVFNPNVISAGWTTSRSQDDFLSLGARSATNGDAFLIPFLPGLTYWSYYTYLSMELSQNPKKQASVISGLFGNATRLMSIFMASCTHGFGAEKKRKYSRGPGGSQCLSIPDTYFTLATEDGRVIASEFISNQWRACLDSGSAKLCLPSGCSNIPLLQAQSPPTIGVLHGDTKVSASALSPAVIVLITLICCILIGWMSAIIRQRYTAHFSRRAAIWRSKCDGLPVEMKSGDRSPLSSEETNLHAALAHWEQLTGMAQTFRQSSGTYTPQFAFRSFPADYFTRRWRIAYATPHWLPGLAPLPRVSVAWGYVLTFLSLFTAANAAESRTAAQIDEIQSVGYILVLCFMVLVFITFSSYLCRCMIWNSCAIKEALFPAKSSGKALGSALASALLAIILAVPRCGAADVRFGTDIIPDSFVSPDDLTRGTSFMIPYSRSTVRLLSPPASADRLDLKLTFSVRMVFQGMRVYDSCTSPFQVHVHSGSCKIYGTDVWRGSSCQPDGSGDRCNLDYNLQLSHYLTPPLVTGLPNYVDPSKRSAVSHCAPATWMLGTLEAASKVGGILCSQTDNTQMILTEDPTSCGCEANSPYIMTAWTAFSCSRPSYSIPPKDSDMWSLVDATGPATLEITVTACLEDCVTTILDARGANISFQRRGWVKLMPDANWVREVISPQRRLLFRHSTGRMVCYPEAAVVGPNAPAESANQFGWLQYKPDDYSISAQQTLPWFAAGVSRKQSCPIGCGVDLRVPAGGGCHQTGKFVRTDVPVAQLRENEQSPCFEGFQMQGSFSSRLVEVNVTDSTFKHRVKINIQASSGLPPVKDVCPMKGLRPVLPFNASTIRFEWEPSPGILIYRRYTDPAFPGQWVSVSCLSGSFSEVVIPSTTPFEGEITVSIWNLPPGTNDAKNLTISIPYSSSRDAMSVTSAKTTGYSDTANTALLYQNFSGSGGASVSVALHAGSILPALGWADKLFESLTPDTNRLIMLFVLIAVVLGLAAVLWTRLTAPRIRAHSE